MTHKILFALTILMTLGAMIVLAHNPRVEVDDWGNFDDPYVVSDGRISFAFFGYLQDAQDVDIFRLDFPEPDSTLRMELFIPACGDHYVDFYPDVFVFGPTENITRSQVESWLGGLCQMYEDSSMICFENTPDPEIRETIGEVPPVAFVHKYQTFDPDNSDPRATRYETHTRRDYYESERIDIPLEDAGSYYLIVADWGSSGGDYLLSTGAAEVFFPPLPNEPESVVMNTDGHWLHRDCSLAPDDPNAIINLPDEIENEDD